MRSVQSTYGSYSYDLLKRGAEHSKEQLSVTATNDLTHSIEFFFPFLSLSYEWFQCDLTHITNTSQGALPQAKRESLSPELPSLSP